MPKKILVVDDEEDILHVLKKRLSVAGYSVVIATNGIDGLAAAKIERPDLIILDIMLPVMDGTVVASALKDDIVTKDIPVIFLTCLVKKEEEKEKSKTVGSVFFAKPYDFNELLSEISKCLK